MHTREDDELAQGLLAMDRKHETFFKQVIETGIVAGLFAGSAMAILWMLVSALAGRGFLMPMKLIAAAWWPDALTGATGVAIVIGVLIHLMVSSLYGIAFASIVRRGSHALSTVLGVVFGIAVYFFMRYAVVPWVDPPMAVALSPWILFVPHLLFGLLLGIAVPARRTVLARAAPHQEAPV